MAGIYIFMAKTNVRFIKNIFRLPQRIECDFIGKTHVLIMHRAKTAFITK